MNGSPNSHRSFSMPSPEICALLNVRPIERINSLVITREISSHLMDIVEVIKPGLHCSDMLSYGFCGSGRVSLVVTGSTFNLLRPILLPSSAAGF